MSDTPNKNFTSTLSAAGVLISFGIIFGDIGTSPIYTFRFIVDEHEITDQLVLGGLSCVFWTLTLVTTFKYVILALSVDNKGEGGIFALYALVRRYKASWVIFPAIIGCCTMLADGFITPAISVTSSIEGLRYFDPEISVNTVITIVVAILVALFVLQQFGSGVMGRVFGPVMVAWFTFMAVIGLMHLADKPEILRAINPAYGFDLLVRYPRGFWILGAVFLCTTGAEALYSDLGHVGKKNIRVSWVFVKIALLLSYFGQGAWLLEHKGQFLGDKIPFFAIIPESIIVVGVIIATLATIVASQALISGTFTLVNEAMKLKLWPAARVRYPSQIKGQIYIPAINWILMMGCILVVLTFRESRQMQGAYGLALIFDMLMTTSLLVYYFSLSKKSTVRSMALGLILFSIEISFLVSNLNKFQHGGWFTFSIASFFFVMMYILMRARRLRQRHTEFVDLKHYVGMIQDLQADTNVPKEATNLVYLAMADSKRYIDSNIIYSIFKKRPKRADVYWFVHVDTVDNPFTSKYVVDTIIPKKCFFIRIKLGFKTDHRVNLIFNKIIHEMADAGEIDLTSPYPALHKYSMMADFKFVILHSWASSDSEISNFERLIIQGYRILKKYSLSTEEMYGIEAANLEVEKVPIQVGPQAKVKIKREKED